jgi:hypothetical protein
VDLIAWAATTACISALNTSCWCARYLARAAAERRAEVARRETVVAVLDACHQQTLEVTTGAGFTRVVGARRTAESSEPTVEPGRSGGTL